MVARGWCEGLVARDGDEGMVAGGWWQEDGGRRMVAGGWWRGMVVRGWW